MAAPFLPIEEKHGPDCTCPAAGRIVIELVAADRGCPGDRNPHRAARTAAELDLPLLRMRKDSDDATHIHQFRAKEPLTVPHQFHPCDCGETFGDSHTQ